MAAKILIVDDQDSILKTAHALLKKARYEVFTASDGYIALEKLSIFTFDLVITDASMPGISGYDLVKSLRIGEKTRNMPVLMLTSRQERRDIEKAIQAKVDDYLIKPIDPVLLLNKVADLLLKSGAGIKLPQATTMEEGDLRFGVKVTAVTEEGLTLVCSQNLIVGSVIPVNSTLFEKIGIPAQDVRVTASQPQGNGFVVLSKFANLQPPDEVKLRDWIAKQLKKAS